MGGPTGVRRVKTGCITCRIRRVKCDEEKPACKRCFSTGRRCDGYSTLPFSRRDLQAASQSASRRTSPFASNDGSEGLLPRLVTDPAFSDLLEKRYFQFFRQRTVASTNSIVDCRFWDRVVLQACHSEPTVKHAVLALSSLHQLSSLPLDSDASLQHRLYAERQHQKALQEARILVASSAPEDIDRILIACIIFVIFEGVRGDYQAAAMHMDSGRAIVAQNSQRLKNTGRRKDLIEIEHAMARLDLPAICFSDESSPYRYALPDFYQTNPVLACEHFQDVSEAQATFIDLARWLLLIINHIEHEDMHGDMRSLAKYQAEKVRCAAMIAKWHGLFEEAVTRSEASDTSLILNLRCWYAVLQVTIQAEGYGPEKRYDRLTHLFAESVGYGEQIAENLADPAQPKGFSYDFGYVIPIYFIATRCREPHLRRRAIRILQMHPRREGVWESTAAAAVAARWVAVEEEGLGIVTCAEDVPEYKRIRFISTRVNVEEKTASLRLSAYPVGESHDVVATWKPNEASADELLRRSPSSPPQVCCASGSIPDFEVHQAPESYSRASSWDSNLLIDDPSPAPLY